MTGLEQTMATMRYFLNNCCFDRNGTAYCRPTRAEARL